MTTYFFQVEGFGFVNRQGYEFIEPYSETFIVEAFTDDEAFAKFKKKFRKEHFHADETKNFVEMVKFDYLPTRSSMNVIYKKEYTLEEVFGDRIIK